MRRAEEMAYLNQLGPTELRQHVEQTHSLWGDKQSVEERLATLEGNLKEVGPERFILSGLVDEQGNLAASLKRYYFPMRVRGESLRAVGLGAVFTPPEARSSGFASHLIRTVLDESRRERDCSVAVLYSDIEPAFYRRLGFESAPAERWRIGVPDLPSERPFPTRSALASDRPYLLGTYRERTKPYVVSTARTEQSWPFFRSLNRVDRDLLLLEGERKIGFLSLSFDRDENYCFVDEWMAPNESERRVWATVAYLAGEAGFSEVRGWAMPTYLHLNGVERADRTRAIPMVAPLRPGVGLSQEDLRASYFAPPDHF